MINDHTKMQGMTERMTITNESFKICSAFNDQTCKIFPLMHKVNRKIDSRPYYEKMISYQLIKLQRFIEDIELNSY